MIYSVPHKITQGNGEKSLAKAHRNTIDVEEAELQVWMQSCSSCASDHPDLVLLLLISVFILILLFLFFFLRFLRGSWCCWWLVAEKVVFGGCGCEWDGWMGMEWEMDADGWLLWWCGAFYGPFPAVVEVWHGIEERWSFLPFPAHGVFPPFSPFCLFGFPWPPSCFFPSLWFKHISITSYLLMGPCAATLVHCIIWNWRTWVNWQK